MGLSKELALQYADEFPDLPTKTVGRIMYAENISAFPTQDAAVQAMRRARGKAGKELRDIYERTGDTEHFKELEEPYNPLPSLPDPIESLEDNPHLVVETERCLILADTQIPYHDPRAIELALAYGEERGPDTILLNGDIIDCFAQSSFQKDPREVDFRREKDATNAFLRHLRGRFPKARIIYKDGNHEERYERYMALKAPELLGIPQFDFQHLLGFHAIGIEHIDKMRHIKIGRLNVVHGHEWGGRGGGGVNPARWLYLRAQATVLCGHFHRTSNHTETDMDGHPTSTWSAGCLCGLTPRWLRYNKWNQGFMYVESNGHDFRLENLRIVEGEVY